MTREQRTAMARIISDMMKADNIIEESEIRDMKKLMSEYAITHQEMSDARKIRQQVYDRLCDLTTVDFFRNVLYERLQVKALHNTPPS